jgi:hypothetical protein
MRHRLVHVCDDNHRAPQSAEKYLRELIEDGWYYTRNKKPPSLMSGEPLVGIGSHGGRGLFILGTCSSPKWHPLDSDGRYKWRIPVNWELAIYEADPAIVLDGVRSVHGRRPSTRSWSSIGTTEYETVVERIRSGPRLDG